MEEQFTPVEQFKFLGPFFENVPGNGLCFNNIYLPEEIVTNILSLVPIKNILRLTLVCKKWCNIIKSENFWKNLYSKRLSVAAKKLPWYTYYCYFCTENFDNLLKNGNGQERFTYWKILRNEGDGFAIEEEPAGTDPLPNGLPEFKGQSSCFVTSYDCCYKIQIISLKEKRLLRYILTKFKPHIYVSEWIAARFDCGCHYKLVCKGFNKNYEFKPENYFRDVVDNSGTCLFNESSSLSIIEDDERKKWKKVEILITDYLPNVEVVVFEHEGCDSQYWKGHYGENFDNLLKNGNGQETFKYWTILRNEGDEFAIEDEPAGTNPLPNGVPEFKDQHSCFVTSYDFCYKIQIISLKERRLLRYILTKFKPHIYVSEWIAGRYDCACHYKLACKGFNKDYEFKEGSYFRDSETCLFNESSSISIFEDHERMKWKKVEILIMDYPPNIEVLVFEHGGCDSQYWEGHYGSKMAGGVVKVVWESIKPLENNLDTEMVS